ncbi:MAG: hypothetical protein ACTS2F_08770 [Thainema sp.]
MPVVNISRRLSSKIISADVQTDQRGSPRPLKTVLESSSNPMPNAVLSSYESAAAR